MYEIEKASAAFCCTGCFLVHKITGTKGEEGISQVLLGKFGLGLILSMNVLLLSMPLHVEAASGSAIEVPAAFAQAIKYILIILSTPVILVLGFPIVKTSLAAIKAGTIGTEFLILIGAFSAYLISVKSTILGTGEVYFETATMILTLFTLGRYIDSRAKSQASKSIKGLSTLIPSTVLILEADGSKRTISSNDIAIGDKVLVRPGEMIPLDGTVVDGVGLVDESFLTGESKPVSKNSGDEVFSGTINIDGNLTLEVQKSVEEFVVKKIEKLMEKIRQNPSTVERISDTIAKWFIPVIMTLALGSFTYWVTKGEPSTGLMRMLSILLISCPCAFGIAAPMAIWRGLGKAAEKGAIIMGAEKLEILSKVKTIFFDKTGTITTNKLTLAKIIPVADRSGEELLVIAASLEHYSTHPMAVSLVNEVEQHGLETLEVDQISNHIGLGIEGEIKGKSFYLGSRSWFDQEKRDNNQIDSSIENEISKSGSSIFLWDRDHLLAVFSFRQSLRDGVVDAIKEVRKLGIETIILTGDDESGARDIADKIDVDNIKWSLLPTDKVNEINKRKASSVTAMVGDGVNDAPALESSHIGIAMGCGTELTRESAKINLLGNDLRLIPYLIQLSKKVRIKVFTNFFWAFFYNIIGVILAINGTITPLFAVIVMIVSSLMVIGNSIQLK